MHALWSGAAIVVLCMSLIGCAASPRQRPLDIGPIETGPGSLTATRKQLEGTWTLKTLQLVDRAGALRTVTAKGNLTYDEFSNMVIRGVVEDESVNGKLALDFTGRIEIDPSRREFRPADLVSKTPASTPYAGPIPLDTVRQYQLTPTTFTVFYFDAAGKSVAIAVWNR